MDIKQEQRIILDMVAAGKIAAEEALELLDALDESVSDDEFDYEYEHFYRVLDDVNLKDAAVKLCFPRFDFNGDLNWVHERSIDEIEHLSEEIKSVEGKIIRAVKGFHFQLN